MANALELFQTYIPLVDEVYKYGATTAALDSNANLVQMAAGGKKFKIPKYSVTGLGDYGRNGKGYPKGSATLTFEEKEPNYDRSTSFGIENQDNQETMGIAFGGLAGEFMRTAVIPEIDAFRYAQYAKNAGFKETGTLSTGEEALAAIRKIMTQMDDNEVPQEGRVLRLTSTIKDMIDHLDDYKRTTVMSKFASIQTVPTARFYSAIDMYDGFADGDNKFGFAKNASAKNLGFVIIHPSAIIQADKSIISKVITPQDNQHDDNWLLFYHNYGICDVLDNKKNGIGVYLAGE